MFVGHPGRLIIVVCSKYYLVYIASHGVCTYVRTYIVYTVLLVPSACTCTHNRVGKLLENDPDACVQRYIHVATV